MVAPSNDDDGLGRGGWLSEHALLLLADAAAQKAAKDAAKEAVHETFLVLGIDLKDEGHVRATRETMTSMRDRWHMKKERGQDMRRGAIHIATYFVISVVTAAVTTLFAHAHWPSH
jgi:hypothetical protein